MFHLLHARSVLPQWYTHTHARTHAYTHACTHHTRMYMCARTHTHMHTHTHSTALIYSTKWYLFRGLLGRGSGVNKWWLCYQHLHLGYLVCQQIWPLSHCELQPKLYLTRRTIPCKHTGSQASFKCSSCNVACTYVVYQAIPSFLLS